MGIFFDEEIAHIARVMVPSLTGNFDGSILQAEYWRGRLYKLLDSTHLTRAQLCALDSLLLQLDKFEAKGRSRPVQSTYSSRPKTQPLRKPQSTIS